MPGMGFAGFKRTANRASRMKSFNWDTLPKARVEGSLNIWTLSRRTQGPQREYQLDTAHMEELFSHGAPPANAQTLKASHRRSLRGLPPSAGGGEIVSVLNPKRSMNVGIFLKQFKRPVQDMIADISSGTSTKFGPGKLRELCKMLPEEGEVKDLNNFKGNKSALAEADLFMLMLIKTPGYEERLNCLVLQEEFRPLMDDMKCSITLLTSAAKELLECENLHSVILLVRKTGNYMNAGGYAGSAIGFRMSSLLKLVDTKANKPGMNLMHYVVMQAEKMDSALLQFPQQLKLLGGAARINKDDLEAEFKRSVQRVQDAKVEVEKQEDLMAQMDGFLKGAASVLDEMEKGLESLNATSDSVAQFFCEDPSKFKLQDCCTIFNTFCEKFTRAIQENKDRIAAEVKKKNRLQTAAKRRSTATCSSWDKEVKGMELESLLHNFASRRSSRRRVGRSPSNQGSPSNGTPQNGSLSEVCDAGSTELLAHSRSTGILSDHKRRTQPVSPTPCLIDSSGQDKAPPPSRARDGSSQTAEVKPPGAKVDRGAATDSTNKMDRGSSTGRRSVGMFSREEQEGGEQQQQEEEEQVGNTPEEAEKLREASRKVLRYQNSRGSVSSGDQVLGALKSPGPSGVSAHRRTLDLDELRSVAQAKEAGDPDRRPLSALPFSNAIGRRHTLCLPSDSARQEEKEEKEEEVWLPPENRTRPSLRDVGKMRSVDSGLYAALKTQRLFDGSQDLVKTCDTEGRNSPPAVEKSSKTNFPFPLVLPDSEAPRTECQTGTPSELGAEDVSKKPQPSPNKSPWIKTDFFGFFKRLGDLTKQPNTKEPVYRGTESSV